MARPPAAWPKPKYMPPNQSNVRSKPQCNGPRHRSAITLVIQEQNGSLLVLEIEMSKPRLRLVHSSTGGEPRAPRRRRGRRFRPLVLQGERAGFAFEDGAWQTGLELVHLGLLAFCRNYVAFVRTSVAVLELCTAPEKTVPRYQKSR